MHVACCVVARVFIIKTIKIWSELTSLFYLFRQLICPFCCQLYKEKRSLDFHLRGVHKVGPPLICEHCGKDQFKSRPTFQRHVRKCGKKNQVFWVYENDWRIIVYDSHVDFSWFVCDLILKYYIPEKKWGKSLHGYLKNGFLRLSQAGC